MRTSKVFLRLLRLVFPLIGYMILAILMGVAGFLCAIFIPVFGSIALICQFYTISLSFSTICICLFLFALCRGVLRYAEQACNHYIAFKLLARIRDKVFSALRELCPAKLEGKDKGNLISLITSDIELLEVFYAHTLSPICIACIVSMICIGIQMHFHILVGSYALFSYCVIGVLLPLYIAKKSKNHGLTYRNQAADLNGYVLESMRGLKESMQYENTKERLKGLQEKTHNLALEEKKLKQFQAKTLSLTNLLVVLLSLGMWQIHVHLSSSLSVTIFSCVLQISSFGPVIALANLGASLSQTIGAGQRVLSLLDEVPVVQEVKNGKDVELDNIKVDSISFAYDKEVILDHFNLAIQNQEILGIQAKSGTGKSTLLKLLMRFWDVQQGKILMDDVLIQDVNTSTLRKKEGYVSQETILFHDTIENNLKVANKNASKEQMIEACKKANIHDFIVSLPNGYQSMVGELGNTLSGGQRQRLGLARMFLHDAKFVLLDEPTSNLDSLNEGILLKSIYEESKNKTLVFVSHKESTLKGCTRIINMNSKRKS